MPTPPGKPPCPFLIHLPRELRDQIYNLIFTPALPLPKLVLRKSGAVHATSNDPSPEEFTTAGPRGFQNILNTYRQIRQEAFEILLSQAVLRIELYHERRHRFDYVRLDTIGRGFVLVNMRFAAAVGIGINFTLRGGAQKKAVADLVHEIKALIALMRHHGVNRFGYVGLEFDDEMPAGTLDPVVETLYGLKGMCIDEMIISTRFEKVGQIGREKLVALGEHLGADVEDSSRGWLNLKDFPGVVELESER